jgi:hypothetical protein
MGANDEPGKTMPEICRFHGIIIAIHYEEHNPPHFHARYGARGIKIKISGLSVMAGHLPPKLLRYVLEWANLHQEELNQNWELSTAREALEKIKPL